MPRLVHWLLIVFGAISAAGALVMLGMLLFADATQTDIGFVNRLNSPKVGKTDKCVSLRPFFHAHLCWRHVDGDGDYTSK